VESIEIFIIEDHPFYIEGVKKTFDKRTDNIFVGGWAKSVHEARKKLKRSKAQVIFLDLVLPGESGVDYCLELKRLHKDKKVIALTGETDEDLLYNVWLNGADAIILKSTGKKQLIKTIIAVLNNKTIISPSIRPIFDSKDHLRNKPFLTKRENQVINLLVNGYQRKEVADMLNISIETVNKHCTNVFHKFKVDSLTRYMQAVKDNIP